MATFPLLDTQYVVNYGGATGTSRGTSITANASANTKATTWTVLAASTAFDAHGIYVMFDDGAAGIKYSIDIAAGTGSAETVLLADLHVSCGTGSLVYGQNYFFPIHIPAGTRITARSAASTGSSAIRVSLLLFSRGMLQGEACNRVETGGFEAADTSGISVDPGGSANALGAWAPIITSTAFTYRYLIVAIGSQGNTVRSSQSWLLDIGIGAGGAEQVIVKQLPLNCSTSPDIIVPQMYMIPIHIPSGSRLSARAQSDGIDATDRLFDIIFYGVG